MQGLYKGLGLQSNLEEKKNYGVSNVIGQFLHNLNRKGFKDKLSFIA